MNTRDSGFYCRHWGGFTAGIVVILIGIVFLLHNFGYQLALFNYQNWWALFILVGAVGPLGYAWQRYRTLGRLDAGAVHSLISGAAIIVVALFFLLDLDWGLWWPVFIIIGGFYTMAGNWRHHHKSDDTAPTQNGH